MRGRILLGLIMLICLFSMVSVQPVKGEWTDTVEIYQSSTPDSRIDVSSIGVVNWKIRWLSNQTEITKGLVIVNVFGIDVDQSIYASYELDCWQVNFISTEIRQLVFSISFVDCYGITDFTQTASNIMITWDRIVVVTGGGEIIPAERIKKFDLPLTEFLTYGMMLLTALLVLDDVSKRRYI